jgi:hypothetical protein
MADDDRQPFFGPDLFVPDELLGEDMEHNVDVTGATNVDVTHTIDHDLPLRRIELGVVLFASLVVAIGTLTDAAPTVQVTAALGAVLLGNAVRRSLAG